jgi:hypothetical protein
LLLLLLVLSSSSSSSAKTCWRIYNIHVGQPSVVQLVGSNYIL